MWKWTFLFSGNNFHSWMTTCIEFVKDIMKLFAEQLQFRSVYCYYSRTNLWHVFSIFLIFPTVKCGLKEKPYELIIINYQFCVTRNVLLRNINYEWSIYKRIVEIILLWLMCIINTVLDCKWHLMVLIKIYYDSVFI